VLCVRTACRREGHDSRNIDFRNRPPVKADFWTIAYFYYLRLRRIFRTGHPDRWLFREVGAQLACFS
jgi:hypothetical protein